MTDIDVDISHVAFIFPMSAPILKEADQYLMLQKKSITCLYTHACEPELRHIPIFTSEENLDSSQERDPPWDTKAHVGEHAAQITWYTASAPPLYSQKTSRAAHTQFTYKLSLSVKICVFLRRTQRGSIT
jgi:hypothetical protein